MLCLFFYLIIGHRPTPFNNEMIYERSEFFIINYPQNILVDNIQEGLNGTISKSGHLKAIL
ncbi:TPA: hypothetical protein JBE16_15995 [Legionella pneumophila subsp. pneumophila]|nr:hypothetical protein [Legionella pneumophila subsp. pneumophila]